MEVALEAYTEPELRSVAKVLGTHLRVFIPITTTPVIQDAFRPNQIHVTW